MYARWKSIIPHSLQKRWDSTTFSRSHKMNILFLFLFLQNKNNRGFYIRIYFMGALNCTTHRVSQRQDEGVLDLLLHVRISCKRVPPGSVSGRPNHQGSENKTYFFKTFVPFFFPCLTTVCDHRISIFLGSKIRTDAGWTDVVGGRNNVFNVKTTQHTPSRCNLEKKKEKMSTYFGVHRIYRYVIHHCDAAYYTSISLQQ